jgi:hypothetical protein
MIRLLQLRNALSARVRPDEIARIAPLLQPHELELFVTMSAAGMRHGLNVFQTLQAAGETDACLLRAGLLHDCGKRLPDGRPLAVGWYILGSQLEHVPALYAWMCRRILQLQLYRDHAAAGAALLTAAGSDRTLCDVVARHHAPSDDWRVQRLKWADAQH